MVSAKKIEHTCPACKTKIIPRGKALTIALTCTNCKLYFCVHTKLQDKFKSNYTPHLPVGSRGTLDGILYEVMGFVVKRERKYRYVWHEYILFNPDSGVAFLSENDGNWNFLRPFHAHPLMTQYTDAPVSAEGTYQLYAKFRADVLFAQGEFFSDVIETTESSTHSEHIHPPYLLTFESNKTQTAGFKGEYIKALQISEAFKIDINKLPAKKSMGYTEPHSFSVNESTLIKMTILTLVAAFLLQYLFNSTALDAKVFEAEFNQTDLKEQKMFVTPSFRLTGGVKNVVFQLSAPVSNDWFFAEYSLINEKTNEEYIFTNEIEYYSGITEGEAWSEGGRMNEAFLSSVPEGYYHINIYPEFSSNTHQFTVLLYRDIPFYSNFVILILILCIFPVAFFAYKRYRETIRWADSDYSPYSSD